MQSAAASRNTKPCSPINAKLILMRLTRTIVKKLVFNVFYQKSGIELSRAQDKNQDNCQHCIWAVIFIVVPEAYLALQHVVHLWKSPTRVWMSNQDCTMFAPFVQMDPG